MEYYLAEKQKSRSPRCEWNLDWTSCDYGRNLRASVSHRTPLLARAILTHSDVLMLSSSEALSIVMPKVEVEEGLMKNAGHAGARCVSQRCWRLECMLEHEAAHSCELE